MYEGRANAKVKYGEHGSRDRCSSSHQSRFLIISLSKETNRLFFLLIAQKVSSVSAVASLFE